jgi:hypothetical protein
MTRVVVDTDVLSFIFKNHPIGALSSRSLHAMRPKGRRAGLDPAHGVPTEYLLAAERTLVEFQGLDVIFLILELTGPVSLNFLDSATST